MSARVEIPDGSVHLSTKRPIAVDVDNAILIGLNESIALSQIRYWIEDTTSGKVVDGERWVYNTYEGWRKSNFPFWSVATIRRVFSSLEDMGLIKSRDDLNQKGSDRTKWYTINFSHSAYGQGVSRPCAQNEQAMCSKRAGHVLKMSSSSIAETTAETTADSPGSDSDESSLVSDHTDLANEEHSHNTVAEEPPVSKSHSAEDLFSEFWSSYPKTVAGRSNRKSSLAKFKLALKKSSFEEIMAGLEWFKNSPDWLKENGRWVPGAQAWLNGERWLDADVANRPTAAPAQMPQHSPEEMEDLFAQKRRYIEERRRRLLGEDGDQ